MTIRKKMSSRLFYKREENPFGQSWEGWATTWCKWLLSIPTRTNPCMDKTGEFCSIDQKHGNVWFLAGTFGNVTRVIRKCRLPLGKAIFFPLLLKEDSFAEDLDLFTEKDLTERARDAIDKVVYMEASIDGTKVEPMNMQRVHSRVFDLVFPEDNVYGVKPGKTRSVCDGIWLFLKPLGLGNHIICFNGASLLTEPYTKDQMKAPLYDQIRELMDTEMKFNLEVRYELRIINETSILD
jgi:hypothetical protein